MRVGGGARDEAPNTQNPKPITQNLIPNPSHSATQPPHPPQSEQNEGDRGPQKAVVASIDLAEVFRGRLC